MERGDQEAGGENRGFAEREAGAAAADTTEHQPAMLCLHVATRARQRNLPK